MVSQQIKLFNDTLAGNISLDFTDKTYDKVIEMCQQYGFDQYFNQFPAGYLTSLGENGINLSGGQQQLLALARALYLQPKVLLLDEPTSAMDRNTEHFVMNLLNRLKTEMTIILVTHRVQLAKKTDYIYVIDTGTIKHQGSHNALIKTDNIYKSSFDDILSTT